MNAVEIEEAIYRLAEQPFDGAEFSYSFLEVFGNKAATIKRLRSGAMQAFVGRYQGGLQLDMFTAPAAEKLR